MASKKRESKASSLDQSPAKRVKVDGASPTPTPKRNALRVTRKNTTFREWSSEDELPQLPAESAEPSAKTPNKALAKRNAPRSAKVNRKDPEWLVTNEKSPLAYEDLIGEFADPKTYENFTKEDWEDLRESLPPDVPLNEDGYSIPMRYFKYDADFRRGIREFQEDLAFGRLEPSWQASAAEAMEERARGKFDAYKEGQFEQFWGQKQKLSRSVNAGESTNVKLEMMVGKGVFKVGDYICYSRVIGRNGVHIEKDSMIVKIEGGSLTMAIPPGQFKYARLKAESEAAADTKTEDNTAEADGSGILVAASSSVTGEAENIAVTENNDDKTINSDNVVNRTSGTTQAEGHDPEQNQAQGVIITEDMQTNGHEPPHDNVECNILPPTAKLEEEDHTWEEKAERAEVVEDMELTGDEISLHSPASNTRCQRCKQRKKSCDKQRPCRRCRDAGIGAEGCIPVVYDVAAATKKRKVHDDDSQAATLNKKSKGNKVESGEKTAENKTPVNLHVKGTDTEAHISVQDKSSATEAPEDTQRQGVALEHSASMSIVRCQRCAKRRIAGCDHKRPCQHCKAAGIGAEGCIPGLDKRSASNRKKGNLPATKKEGSQASPTTKTTRLGTEFSEPETDECVMGNETGASRAPEVAEVQEVQPSSTNEKGTQSLTVVDGREVVLHTITNPSQLEKKIIEVDGRIKVKDLPTFNTWRTSRGLRNNQDLGTLFEMREAFYVYQYPMITRPRKSRKAD